MPGRLADGLIDVDALEVQVLVDDVTDSLSTVPADVVNVLSDARKMFGDAPLHAVMGGSHLSGKTVEGAIPERRSGASSPMD